jgi:L-alanine-DL-glutamate epimerase-like enolase superfamily enzyme
MTAPLEQPMTPEQAQGLKALAQRTGDPDAFDETLSSGEAAKRIAALEVLLDRESHSGQERLPRT